VADDNGAPAPGGGGSFSLSKRYGPLPAWAWGLIGGGAVYAAYRFYQSRHASGSSTAATSGSGADQSTGVDFAPQIATLQAEIEQLQQGEGGEAVSTPPSTTPTSGGGRPPIPDPGPKPRPPGGAEKVMPDVVGQRANFAIGELKTGYGIHATTVPVRNPRNEYTVTGQTPRAGTRVSRGTPAVLRVKVSKRAA
jgi:hypothetical protein